ncbi:EamA family transporter [Luteolibacter pohnpeiensis]|uniref:EamA family transporter n=1 Tax=Luteolibacter pohnpeiensis TaxID=454153 RepID=A0A934VQI5_9BACT|nr:EamA family transporter [Luteolibacter pohnpeiensis]MBK1882126.1 EamA family transporter [Luteolibacter pohnpeiensis]
MKPIFQLHLLVMVFAATAILGRLISLPAPAIVCCRTFLAAVGAAIVTCLFKRKSLAAGKDTIRLLLIGALVGLHWLCFFGAVKVANISICLAGVATISLFTAFTEPWLEKRPIRMSEVLLGGLVAAGIVMIAGFERSSSHLLGLAIALLAAFLAAVFPVLNRRLVNQGRLDTQVMVAWEMTGAFIVVALLMPIVSGNIASPIASWVQLFQWHGYDWIWLLALSWICTVFAHGFHIHLLRSLSAYTSNLAINFEPVYGITAALIIFKEYQDLHPGFYFGTLTIIGANAIHAGIPWWKARKQRNLLDP